MKTIIELEDWMSKNEITNTFTPKFRYRTDEGLGLEKLNDKYVLYFIEKGNRQDIEFFNHEIDAVNYIYNYLKNER